MSFFAKCKWVVFLSLVTSSLPAQVRLSNVFGDHMVLQRQKPLAIWGWSTPGDQITVSFNGQSGTAVAGADSSFRVVLPAMEAGGPFVLKVSGTSGSQQVQDVLIGEVWITSGQSNMELAVSKTDNAQTEIAGSANNNIRYVRVPKIVSIDPEKNIDSAVWRIASPKTTGQFSAVAYYFAREINQSLNVPVGIINNSWSGSQIEGWISRDAMQQSPVLSQYLAKLPSSWDQRDQALETQQKTFVAKNNGGQTPAFDQNAIVSNPSLSAHWISTRVNADWDLMGLQAFQGEGMMSDVVDLSGVSTNQPSQLSLGSGNGPYEVFINGKSAGTSDGSPFVLSLPAGAWSSGRNTLLVHQEAHPDAGKMGLRGDSTLFFVKFGDRQISLAGKGWKLLPLFDKPHHYRKLMNAEGTIIYNTMVHPLIGATVRGILWYQGEANTPRAHEYNQSFPLMIESWRKDWKEELPFYFVQLSSLGQNTNSNTGSAWAELREAQLKTLSLPKTEMAVTIDVGNPKDIHYSNKQAVGHRLAAIALNDLYGKTQVHSGPIYDAVSFNGAQAVLTFQSVGSGLAAKPGTTDLTGFEIAGADHQWYDAQASISGNTVVVSNSSVSKPVAVRYAWSNDPINANLFNKDGFPASPFRTDNWPGVTDNMSFLKPAHGGTVD